MLEEIVHKMEMTQHEFTNGGLEGVLELSAEFGGGIQHHGPLSIRFIILDLDVSWGNRFVEFHSYWLPH